MIIDFSGQCVLVAGAARGIGRGIVQGFANSGGQVFAADRLGDEMAGLPAAARQVDLLDRAAVRAWVEAATEAAGRAPDVLVYVAGGVLGQRAKPMEEVDEAEWRAVLDANLTGAFLTAQAVVPGMKARGKGRIVFIASGAGLRTSLTGIQAYASAKAGEIGLARQLGQELGPFGITVNAIAPGFIETAMTAKLPENVREAAKEGIAMRSFGSPDDVAKLVTFLASDDAGYITGQTVAVDGGMTFS